MATPAPAQASSRTGWGNSGSAFRGGRGGGPRRGGGGRRGAGSQRQGSTTTTSTPATPAPAPAPTPTQAKPAEKASSQADKPLSKTTEKPSPAKAAPTPTEKTPSTPSQPKGKRARGRQGSANTTTSDANSVSTASVSPAQAAPNGRPPKANSQAASPAINGNAKKEDTAGRRRNARAPRSKPAPLSAASLHPSSAGSLAASQSAPNTSLLTPNASLRHNLSLLVEHARSATPGSASHIDWANEEEDELPDLDDWAVDAKKSDEESAESHDEVKADVKPKGLSPGAQMDLLISPIIVDGLTSLPDLVIESEDANPTHPKDSSKATTLQSARLHPSLPKKPTLGVLAAGPQDTIRGAMPMRLGGAQATGRKGAKSPGPASKSPVAQDRSLYSSMHAPKPAQKQAQPEPPLLHAPKPQMPKPPVLQEPVSEEPLFPSISNDFILNTTNSACPSPAPPKSPNLQTEEHYDSHASKTNGGGFGQNGNGHHRPEFTGNRGFGGRGGFGNGNGNGFRGGRGGLGHTLAGMTSHPRYLNGNRGGRGGPRGGADFGRGGFTSGHKSAFSDEMGGSTNESGHARTHSAPNGAQPQQHKRTSSRPIITGDAISRLARTIGGNVGLGPREERDKGQGEKAEA